MGEEITKILETINEGLRHLPPYASDTWDLMVQGVRLDGVIRLTVSIIILIAVIGGWLMFAKFNDPTNMYESTDMFFFVLFSLIFVGLAIFGIMINLRAVIMPDYHLIKQLLQSVGV